jgi:hypothetical protein
MPLQIKRLPSGAFLFVVAPLLLAFFLGLLALVLDGRPAVAGTARVNFPTTAANIAFAHKSSEKLTVHTKKIEAVIPAEAGIQGIY